MGMPTNPLQESMVSSIERVLPNLKRFIALQVGPHLQADLDATDVMQDVALLALRIAPRLTFESDSATAVWLRMVTHRVTAERARKQALRPQVAPLLVASNVPSSSLYADPVGRAELVEEGHRAIAALGRLTLTDRSLLTQRFLEGRSNTQLSHQLRCKPTALRVRLHRALGRLRSELR